MAMLASSPLSHTWPGPGSFGVSAARPSSGARPRRCKNYQLRCAGSITKGDAFMTRNVAILIFDEVEVLDFCGPFEVFGVTGVRDQGERPFHVYTVAEKAGPVLARNGLSVNPGFTFANCPPPDILLVPGGRGTRREIHNEALVNWVRAQAGRVELLLSVCTGALILAQAGLLDGLSATTHFLAFEIGRAS